ncbi:hypothetical protein GGR33_004934 [Methylobacterium brachythecii]|uniref:Uncharacterized protein n=1 Tax=Methylobacterium brachythecii TaxID=1176177 RepID=A0A7W6ARL6_9HYPH|nr:hypothetical protein [Methylobacterium brachythecii]
MAESPTPLRTVIFTLLASFLVGASVLPMAFWTSRAIGLW